MDEPSDEDELLALHAAIDGVSLDELRGVLEEAIAQRPEEDTVFLGHMLITTVGSTTVVAILRIGDRPLPGTPRFGFVITPEGRVTQLAVRPAPA